MADTKKEERSSTKERVRAYYRSRQSCAAIDLSEIEKEMAIRYEIAVRMMMDQVPDEKIRYYCLLSHMQIDYVRTNLLTEAIKDMECRNRAMNESLRGK